jgi:hypothetical protein
VTLSFIEEVVRVRRVLVSLVEVFLRIEVSTRRVMLLFFFAPFSLRHKPDISLICGSGYMGRGPKGLSNGTLDSLQLRVGELEVSGKWVPALAVAYGISWICTE